jgi:mannose-6-phosphate isomerase-like protein (cupin superfamily)
MGFGIHIDEVEGEEIAPGVIERVLFRPEQTGRGPPGQLSVKHYTLSKRAKLTLQVAEAERLDFIISGALLIPRGGARDRYYFSNTAILAPLGTSGTYIHGGETEARLVSFAYTVPDPSPTKRYMSKHVAPLADYWGESQGVPGYLRIGSMHRIGGDSFQIKDRVLHTNPEETAYFLRGWGKMQAGDKVYDVQPGSLVYAEDGEEHEIMKDDESPPQNYIIIEYHHDNGGYAGYPKKTSLITKMKKG